MSIRFYDLKDAKYALACTHRRRLPQWNFGAFTLEPFLHMSEDGYLSLLEGFPWNGVSGPTIDRRTNLPASLWHDALYLAIGSGVIPKKEGRKYADWLMFADCRALGMAKPLAWAYVYVLRVFGRWAARTKAKDVFKVRTMPTPW